MTATRRCNIGELAPGMILAKDVVARDGRLLLPSDTRVEAHHLRVLNIWGVAEVQVLDSGGPVASAAAETDAMRTARAHAEHVLSLQPPDNALTDELLQVSTRFLVQSIELGSPLPTPVELQPTGSTTKPPSLDQIDLKKNVLASFPDIYFKIMRAVENPDSTAQHLADIVSKDTSLSAKLLKVINSPLYGFSGRISSLARGVALLGTRELTQLAIGVSVLGMFQDIPAKTLNLRDFWQHSLACAVLAHNLAAQSTTISREHCFVGGILHDIGRLIMLRLAPGTAMQAMNMAMTQRIPLYTAEQALFGYDHTHVADRLFREWQIPENYRHIVATHHAPENSDSESTIVHVADALAIALGFGTSGSFLVPPVSFHAWERLRLPLGALQVCAAQARRSVADIVDSLLGKA